MTLELVPFDRDVTMGELLKDIPRLKIEQALSATIGGPWRLTDDEGQLVAANGPEFGRGDSVALVLECESLGVLEASNAPPGALRAGAAWLEMILRATQRYRMAAALHLEAIQSDFQALQKKHEELKHSEARYCELCAQLDQRVKEQVEIIERTQRRLFQSEKMAAIGSLASGMAHEINNPVGFIRSNLATAGNYLERLCSVLEFSRRGETEKVEQMWGTLDISFTLEDFQGLLKESLSGADRVAHIVSSLKAFASIDVADRAPVDLNACVRSVVEIVKAQLTPEISIEVNTLPLPDVVCDQSRMNQVLFALVQNARQAIEGQGVIRISTCVVDSEIRIAISDTGCGIDPQTIGRIFDPFFTTRDVGKGMGLGLTVSRDVVDAHHGRIEVDSTPGAGSTFTVCLPRNTQVEGTLSVKSSI